MISVALVGSFIQYMRFNESGYVLHPWFMIYCDGKQSYNYIT